MEISTASQSTSSGISSAATFWNKRKGHASQCVSMFVAITNLAIRVIAHKSAIDFEFRIEGVRRHSWLFCGRLKARPPAVVGISTRVALCETQPPQHSPPTPLSLLSLLSPSLVLLSWLHLYCHFYKASHHHCLCGPAVQCHPNRPCCLGPSNCRIDRRCRCHQPYCAHRTICVGVQLSTP